MKPDVYNGIVGLAADHGIEAASEVAAFEAKHVTYLKEFIDREKIDCEYVVTKAVDVQLSQDHFNKLKNGYEGLIKNGCKPTANATCIDTPDAEKVGKMYHHFISRSSANVIAVLGSQGRKRLFYL